MFNPFSKKRERLDPVSPEDGIRAKDRLQMEADFNIDDFLASQTAEVLFNSPLGPTKDCLSIENVAAVVEKELVEPTAQMHLASCAPCREQLEIYTRLKQEKWRELYPTDFASPPNAGPFSTLGDRLGFVPGHIDIYPATVRVPVGGKLYLILRNLGPGMVLSSLDPTTVLVEGPIEGAGYRLDPLDPQLYVGASEVVALHFDKFKLNVPEGGQICDYLRLEARTPFGRIHTSRLVRVIDEAKLRA